jgi:hypothetical protein
MAAYTGTLAALAAVGALAGRRLPKRMSAADLALVTVASHKLSRLLTKDAVTSPLRAPVTSFAGPAGAGEVHEEVRGSGARHVLGEMVTCPFCLDLWIATALCSGIVIAPRATRMIAAGLTAVTGADFLQLAYDAAKKATGNTG